MICEITGMDIANASLLDEATAAAEAMIMLYNSRTREQIKNDVVNFFVDENIFPQTLEVIKTRSNPIGINVISGDYSALVPDSSFFATMVQYPNVKGEILD